MVIIRRIAVAHAACALLLAAALPAAAQPPAAASPPPPVRAAEIASHVYVLTGGRGANSSLLVGSEGALLVDSKGLGDTDQILAIIASLGSGPLEFLVNGHVHPDHTDGNANFGRRGVVIVAHREVRDVLAAGQRGGPPAPPEALPTLLFDDGGEIALHLNGDTIRV